jgi:hypothetical protein
MEKNDEGRFEHQKFARVATDSEESARRFFGRPDGWPVKELSPGVYGVLSIGYCRQKGLTPEEAMAQEEPTAPGPAEEGT